MLSTTNLLRFASHRSQKKFFCIPLHNRIKPQRWMRNSMQPYFLWNGDLSHFVMDGSYMSYLLILIKWSLNERWGIACNHFFCGIRTCAAWMDGAHISSLLIQIKWTINAGWRIFFFSVQRGLVRFEWMALICPGHVPTWVKDLMAPKGLRPTSSLSHIWKFISLVIFIYVCHATFGRKCYSSSPRELASRLYRYRSRRRCRRRNLY